jgi:hypothetical protein
VSRRSIAAIVAIALAAAVCERYLGRPLVYRHGPIRFWSGNVQSDQNSQQVADPYTFTHFEHGALFYGLTALTLGRLAIGPRAVVAVALESIWEVYENTDTVIERYRKETISLGYYGDSIVNSMADILACVIGFVLAWKLPRSATVVWVITLELLLALWIRDNLTLNVVMLIRPVAAIKRWQMGA